MWFKCGDVILHRFDMENAELVHFHVQNPESALNVYLKFVFKL